MKSSSFQHIDSAKSIDFEVEDGNVAGLVMRRLCRTMHYQIKALGTEERFKGKSVPNIDIVMREVFRIKAQPIEVPGGIASATEKKPGAYYCRCHEPDDPGCRNVLQLPNR